MMQQSCCAHATPASFSPLFRNSPASVALGPPVPPKNHKSFIDNALE